MTSNAQKKAIDKWQRENVVRVYLKLYRNTDPDLIQYLDGVESKQGTIKKALREYMKKEK